jgi:predicted metal-binding membrane protein
MPRVPVLLNFARAPWPLLFAMAGIGLMLSLNVAGSASLPAFCGGGAAWLQFASNSPDALVLALASNPPVRLMADWASMLLAMMPPLLAMPLMHVWRSSLPRRRPRALACFVVGYSLVWMAAGPILIGAAILLQLVVRADVLAFVAALLIAAVWGASPWQRAALNQSHRLRRIGLFGWAADRECLTFGVIHAVRCVASCWAWMLVPLVAGPWHVPAMILAGAVMLRDRLTAPDRPHWRLPAFLQWIDFRPIFGQRQGMMSP